MKVSSLSTLLIATTLLGGCATMKGPSPKEISALPVIPYGEQTPADGRYVLRFPAGKPVNLPVRIEGRLFSQSAEKNMQVLLARDVYSYKDWVSFDGSSWEPANEALKMRLSLTLPSWEKPRGGELILRIDPAQ